jgi:hypothetical protein
MLGMPIRPTPNRRHQHRQEGKRPDRRWAETSGKTGRSVVLIPFKAEIFGHGPTSISSAKRAATRPSTISEKLGYRNLEDVTSKIREQVKEYPAT